MIYRFACGHAGRTNESYRAKMQAFIRVAEIREPVEDSPKMCPNCGRGKQ